MNYVFSHPRSGRNWQRYRMLHFLQNIVGMNFRKRGYTDMDQFIHFTHIGYGDALLNQGPVEEERWSRRLTAESSNITVLLREAKAVVASYYTYVKGLFPGAITDLGLDLEDIEGFVRSPLGIQHYVDFMHTAQEIQSRSRWENWRYIFYEDAFEKKFIYNLPHMAGMPQYSLPDEAVEEIHSKSVVTPTKLIGKLDGWKQVLSLSQGEYIDNYILSECKSGIYHRRYND
jgi:hypothetical protein